MRYLCSSYGICYCFGTGVIVSILMEWGAQICAASSGWSQDGAVSIVRVTVRNGLLSDLKKMELSHLDVNIIAELISIVADRATRCKLHCCSSRMH